jgi:glycine hydroxymethyltransferase
MRDKRIESLIKKEIVRQAETLDLIASENFVSSDVREALGSVLTNKYSEGYPGKRYYPGNVYYDEIEELAKERALKVFHLDPKEWHVNVQPYSGSPANLAIYSALIEPGETIMGMALSSGGHLTHGHKVSMTGKFWRSVQYTVNQKTGLIDFAEVKKLAEKEKPKIIISGFTAYPRLVNFKKFGEIAKGVGAYHVSDISHIAGLIAAGVHPSPFAYVDVVMTTTHKTLRGPRGAMIFCRKEHAEKIAEKIDRAVFPGLQGGPHNNATAAKAIAFFEALQPSFKKYAGQIVKNAKVLGESLAKHGFKLVTGGTDTHLLLLDVGSFKLMKHDPSTSSGQAAEKKLESVGIIANRNTIPGDPSPFKPSGLRLGTPAVTSMGMKEKEMKEIAALIYGALTSSNLNTISKSVKKLAKRFSKNR